MVGAEDEICCIAVNGLFVCLLGREEILPYLYQYITLLRPFPHAYDKIRI